MPISDELKNLRKQILTLSNEFTKEFGPQALEHFLNTTNEKHVYTQEFNRSGSPFIIGYFMACALNRPDAEKAKLLKAFLKEATPIGGSADKPMTGETAHYIHEKIIEAAQHLKNAHANPDNDNHDPDLSPSGGGTGAPQLAA